MQFENTLEFAQSLDAADPLKEFRQRFIIPGEAGREQIYFLGNSLGLQPKSANVYIQRIMHDWAQLGVEGFFHAEEPWMNYHEKFTATLSTVLGTLPSELVVMNQLTVNLHLMLISFYRPTKGKYKIICEAKAFPSDQYMLETHLRQRGFDPTDAIIEVTPRSGEQTLRTEDIIAKIKEHGHEIALVLFGGINYYTGQLFDLPAITQAGHAVGAVVGFDLAHAAGNVELQLHNWNIDFACWCNYKYLNSGPGSIAGAYIHERHHTGSSPRFAGWWGNNKATQFKMEKGFQPMQGAAGWQLSTPSMLLYATHRAALEIIEDAGWEKIQAKRKLLNAFAWFMLQDINKDSTEKLIEFITPLDPDARGSQISMLMLTRGRMIYEELMKNGLIVDWREPNVIRLAPVPLYNTFGEVWTFGNTLKKILDK